MHGKILNSNIPRITIWLLLALNMELGFSSQYPMQLYPINEHDSLLILSDKIVINNTAESFGDGEHFRVYGQIKAPMEVVFNIINKEEEYPKFMPRFTDVDYLYTDNNSSYYTFHIGLPLNIKYQYKIKITESQNKESAWIAWELVDWEKNSIADTWGQWYFTPLKNNSYTLIQYQTYIDPGYIPFGAGWIIDLLTRTSLPQIVKNSKDYIESK